MRIHRVVIGRKKIRLGAAARAAADGGTAATCAAARAGPHPFRLKTLIANTKVKKRSTLTARSRRVAFQTVMPR